MFVSSQSVQIVNLWSLDCVSGACMDTVRAPVVSFNKEHLTFIAQYWLVPGTDFDILSTGWFQEQI